MLNVTFLTILQ